LPNDRKDHKEKKRWLAGKKGFQYMFKNPSQEKQSSASVLEYLKKDIQISAGKIIFLKIRIGSRRNYSLGAVCFG